MSELKKQINELDNAADVFAKIRAMIEYLPACEYELIKFMHESGIWKKLPPEPKGYKPGDGTVDLGLILFWIHNKKLIDKSELNELEIVIFDGLIDFLETMVLPKSLMTMEHYDFFKKGGELIYTDGSILSMKKWATYDQGWFLAFFNLLKTVSINNWYGFQGVPSDSIKIKGRKISSKVKIAIIGDWGTGDAAAKALISQVVKLEPDYIIHLGDVYYAGTPKYKEWHPLENVYFDLGEEQKHLLDLWPSEYRINGRSFTLNSNHEMYSGANGYFSNALTNHTFSAQNGKSCFVLKFGDWNILGLDSAYYGSSKDAFMKGSIGESGSAQSNWIKNLNLNADKTIVLTHHTGFSDDCSALSPLWHEIQEALGKDPYAWYWGHVHNGIVYDSPITIPNPNTKPQSNFTTKTFARCSGHAALPFGLAETVVNNNKIAWYANSQKSNNELYNGFTMIELSSENSIVDRVSEEFYDLAHEISVYAMDIFPVYKKKNNSSDKKSVLLSALDTLNFNYNQELYDSIKKSLGPSIYKKDASLVACSDPKELKRIKTNFLIAKLGLADTPKLDEAIHEICQSLGKSNRNKSRVDFYYILVAYFKKESLFV